MELQEIRKDIDAIDPQIRELLMRRMDCSYQVAQAKLEAGSTDIYRADREQAILDRLGAEVPDDRRAPYLAVVRKVMEASRMYQYGLIYAWDPGLFSLVEGHELATKPSTRVTVRLTRDDRPGAMATILSMVGDYGYDLDAMELAARDEAARTVTFDLTIRGDVSQDKTRCLLLQLSKESADFRILESD